MMLYGWRERELILDILEMITGLRMNHNYIRVGGVAADLPHDWRDDVLRILDTLPDRLAISTPRCRFDWSAPDPGRAANFHHMAGPGLAVLEILQF